MVRRRTRGFERKESEQKLKVEPLVMTNFWEILDFETDGFRFRLPAVAKVLENQKLLEVYSPLN